MLNEVNLINMETVEICEFCDGEIEYRIIQARFHFKGSVIYVDGVPAWVCNKCNEHYFDADVYKKLEDIAKNSQLIEKTICFPLAEYNMAVG
jgi:HTH-type transcriptional regulator/antitoxin MqsA